MPDTGQGSEVEALLDKWRKGLLTTAQVQAAIDAVKKELSAVPKKVITVRMDEDLHDKITRAALAQNISMNSLCIQLLNQVQ